MKHLFILHRRPLRESRLLLDIWSREDGRQQMVIRERPETIYEPGQTYRADWRDAEEWPEAFAFHCETVRHFNGDALACLLYLNELIVNLVPRQERQSQLFDY
ncbi:MAG: DNA repair protein RecO, partial [Oceanobacter sp.]